MNSTPHYRYKYVETNDIIWAGYDQRNMAITENQLADISSYIGSGVLEGWLVTPMVSTNEIEDIVYKSERIALFRAYMEHSDVSLAQQYIDCGKPADTYEPCLVCVSLDVSDFAAVPISHFDGLGSADLVDGSRILVTGQTDETKNGVYVSEKNLDDTFSLSRSLDMPESATIPNPSKIKVLDGITYTNNVFVFMKPAGYTYTVGGTTPADVASEYNMDWVADEQAKDVSWKQVIRVTPGEGILGYLRAYTSNTAYFSYEKGGTYYVWVESGPCLTTEGIAVVTAPLDQDYDRDLNFLATFLASVDVLPDTELGYGYIIKPERILDDKRVTIKGFKTALEDALAKTFKRHVHSGDSGMPQKIRLDTQIIYNAYFNASYPDATSFLTNPWDADSLGEPEVRLNNVVLSKGDYELAPSQGYIYLKNNVPSGSVVQLIFPLAPQVALTPTKESTYALDQEIFLTDGTVNLDESQTDGIFRWNADDYLDPQVFVDGELIVYNSASPQYVISANGGSIIVNSSSGITLPDDRKKLVVYITKRVYEVTGKLSSKRIGSIDAASFKKGIIDPSRLGKISHVGDVRLNEVAALKPIKKVFAEDDEVTFMPEIPDSPMQCGTDVHAIHKSINLTSYSTLIGTKRGMLATDDFQTIIPQPAWNPDNGQPVQFIDNLMPETPKDPNAKKTNNNAFNTLYVRTLEGDVYFTPNQGTTWIRLRMPLFESDGIVSQLKATAFWCFTDMELIANELQTTRYRYFTQLYVGTNQGLFTATIYPEDGDDWAWVPSYRQGERINDVVVVATLNSQITYSGRSMAVSQQQYDKTVYVATDTGLFINGKKFSYPGMDVAINKVHWVNFGTQNANKNALLYYSDKKLCITHSARCEDYVVSGNFETKTATYRWVHPLTETAAVLGYPNGKEGIKAASNENIDIIDNGSDYTLPSTIDGVTSWSVNDLILIKKQANSYENGVYKVTSTSGGVLTCEKVALSTGVRVKIYQNSHSAEVEASKQYGSEWYLPLAQNPEDTNTTAWNLYFYMYDRADSYNYDQDEFSYTNASLISEYQQYFLGCLPAPLMITDQNVGIMPVFTEMPYWNNRQKLPKVGRYYTGLLNGVQGSAFLVAGERGLWFTDDYDGWSNWRRFNKQFTVLDAARYPTLWHGNEAIVAESMPSELLQGVPTAYAQDSNLQKKLYFQENLQIFEFSHKQPVYKNYLYLDSYTDYYVAPFDVTATISTTVNNQKSEPLYVADEGKIVFPTSLKPSDVVLFTAIRDGAYISDAGKIPHEEQGRVFVVLDDEPNPITLAADFPSTNASTADKITVNTPSRVPDGYSIIEIRASKDSALRERLYIYKNPVTFEIRLAKPRTVRSVMPSFAVGSPVYLVEIQSLPGLQDYISQITSGQMYHMNSVFLLNTIMLNLNCLDFKRSNDSTLFPNLLHNYASKAKDGTEDNRGPQNASYFVSQSQFEDVSSDNSLTVEYAPEPMDMPDVPKAVFNIDIVNDGASYLLGTDQGVWSFTTGDDKWQQASKLNGSSRTYFIESIDERFDGNLVKNIGTELGLFRNVNGEWVSNPTFFQAVFDVASGEWNGKTAAFYAKNDGLSFVQHDAETGTFVSDNYDPLKDQKLYCLFKDKFTRVVDGEPPKFVEFDAALIGSETGLYGVTTGSRSGIPHPTYLTGRKVLATPSSFKSPMRVYKVEIAPSNSKRKPLYVLTDQGLLQINPSWHFCDPADPKTIDFTVDKIHLAGLTCNCVVSKVTSTEPYAHVVYVGTNEGVFKSATGQPFERCERIAGELMPVYDLKIINKDSVDIVIAATESGVWMSDDGGDTWRKPSVENSEHNLFPGEINSVYEFKNAKLAQTFTTPNTSIDVTKLGAHLSRRTLTHPSTGVYDEALTEAAQNNQLMLALYTVNGSGNPVTPLSLTSFNSKVRWGVGYQTSPQSPNDFNASQILDNEEFDIKTYYEESSEDNDSSITFLYTFDQAKQVDAVKFSAMHTQILNVTIEYSDNGSDFTAAVTDEAYAAQNDSGVPLWRNEELATGEASSHKYWRISFKDNYDAYATLLRVGDLRLYMVDGADYTLHDIFDAINAYEIGYPSFRSMKAVEASAGSLALTANTKYILVGNEILSEQVKSVLSGYGVSSSDYQKYGSVIDWTISSGNEYSNGEAKVSANGTTWSTLAKDFLFKVYYAANPVPIATIEPVGNYGTDSNFDQGEMYGLIVNDAGGLTTDFKVATCIVADDSKSQLWADENLSRGERIYNFYSKIWAKCNGKSTLSYWQFGNKELDITNGFLTEDNINGLSNVIINFTNRGKDSDLLDTCFNAFAGLSPQSMVDSVLPVENMTSQTYDAEKVAEVVNDLNGKQLLRLSYLQSKYEALLDGATLTIDDIINNVYPAITRDVVERWANSFVPLALVFADGDDYRSDNDSGSVASLANTGWNDFGFGIYSGGIGTGSEHRHLREISRLSNGAHAILNSDEDWNSFGNSFLPQGDNSVFKGHWSRQYDFETPTWVREIVAKVNVPPTGVANSATSPYCNIEFRYTLDRTHWTGWINIASQNKVSADVFTYTLNKEVLGIEYRVVLENALEGTAKPVVSELYHVTVEPARKYLITPKKPIDGLLFEYMLGANVNIPNSCKINWGIVRGDSINFEDYESVFINRKGCLSNRQNSLMFTDALERRNMPKSINSAYSFVQVYKDIEQTIPASWAVTDDVQIWIQISASPNGRYWEDGSHRRMRQDVGGVRVYELDGVNGTITFSPALVPGTEFKIDIVSPERLAYSIGENTTTKDNRTYYSVNGRWSYDATVYVLVQTDISAVPTLIRGGYWLNSEEGSVTFSRERSRSDIVKLFIVPEGYFRIGAEILSYTDSEVSIDNFGVYYTIARNASLGSVLAQRSVVSLKGNRVDLTPEAPSLSDSILNVGYAVVTSDESPEQGSRISWWVGRPTFTGTTTGAYKEFDPVSQMWFYRINVHNRLGFTEEDGVTPVFATDGDFPLYEGRTRSRQADKTSGLFQEGDLVFVKVAPSNGFGFGQEIRSNTVQFSGDSIPNITNLSIADVVTILVDGVNQNKIEDTRDLVPVVAMSPSFNPPAVDYNVVWYRSDAATPIDNGGEKVLKADKTVLGKVYYCQAQPINGTVLGGVVYSEPVIIVNSTS